MKFLRMRPGYGEQLIAEGDVEVAEDEERLVAEFRRQLEQGSGRPSRSRPRRGRREAEMVRAFEDVPRATDRVIFFPRAAGGARRAAGAATLTVALAATAIVVLALLWEVLPRGPTASWRSAAPTAPAPTARACPATTPAASAAPSSAPASC